SGTAERATERLSQMGNQFMFEQAAGRAADRRKSFGELVEDQKLEMFDMEGNRIDTGAGPIEYMGAFSRWIDARYADLIGTDDESAAADSTEPAKANRDASGGIAKPQVVTESEAGSIIEGDTVGDALSNFGSALLSNPAGGSSWALETAC